MLLERENRTVESVGIQEVARATIKTSPKIFNFFADQTYANKPRAICRELVANAFDSHVMAGKGEVPVEVWLPTILEPTFKVRDQGLGMSHSFMMNEFMCYADGSTKDGSNVAIGGFGIGSKSPFAYVDQYTVRSVFDGIESIYSIFKDEEGIPSIALLGQRTTSEHNGVEVSFPVKPDDFETFEQAAFESLKYFEPLPDIKNATEGSFNPPEYVARGGCWGMRPNAGSLQVIMGGVMYPVSTGNLSYKFPHDSAAYKLLDYGLDLRVPIGTCSVALSREALSYDDRTIEAIRKACDDVIDEVAETFANMFDQYDSEWEAKTALHLEIENTHGNRGKFLAEHAKWRGQPLSATMDYPRLVARKPDEGPVYYTFGYDIWWIGSKFERKSRRAKSGVKAIGPARFASPDKVGFNPGAVGALVIDDLGAHPKHRVGRRLTNFADELGESVLVIRPHEWLGKETPTPEQIIEGFGRPNPCRIAFTSDLPPPEVVRAPRQKGERPRVRMFTWNGTDTTDWRRHTTRQNLNPGRWGKTGVEEIAYEDQPEAGILVAMDNFVPPVGIRKQMESGLIDWDELLFVNAGDVKKLKGFDTYEAAFERRLKHTLSEYPELPQRLALRDSEELRGLFDFFSLNRDVDFTSRKPLGQIFNLYKRYIEPLTSAQIKVASFVTAKLPRGVKPAELLQKFKDKQPKAARLLELFPNYLKLEESDLRLFKENL
jgi:hypothetical protein